MLVSYMCAQANSVWWFATSSQGGKQAFYSQASSFSAG